MQLYGLLGYPLGHSFSVGYFAEKFRRESIDARYDNFEYPTIEEAVDFLRSQPDLVGFNVTIPYKQAILPYLSRLSPEAEAIGAVNVVRVERNAEGETEFAGDNSDWIGFTASLRPLLRPDIHRRALILGTGGASRAVVYALHRLGIQTQYVSRHSAPGVLTYGELTADVMRSHTVIVNCSPVGMYPHVDEAPAIPYHLLSSSHLLYDLVYNPLDTRFMQLARPSGATTSNGLAMLHLQAEAAWKMWTRVY